MAFNNYFTSISHGSDASFRIWGLELATAMQGCGLVKTTDTGQIDWTTVVRAATNTAAGYEIYRFNDALQATYPVFIKLEYGTGSGAANPLMWITAGTSTNGAGTLGTVKTTRFACGCGKAITSTVTAFNTFVCHKDGFLGVVFKTGGVSAAPNSMLTFCVGRTVDDNGAEDGEGIYIVRKMEAVNGAGATGGLQLHILRVATNTTATSPHGQSAGTEPFNYCLVPFGPSTSAVASDVQAYKWYVVMPRVRPLMQVCTVITSEFTYGQSFTTALVGATPRTFMTFGASAAHCSSRSYGDGATLGNNHGMAMLWE